MSDTLKSWSIEKITRLISNLLKKNQGTVNAGKFMKVGNDGNLVPDTVPDPTNKADKVTNATAGNFAGLDATGNLTDSGKSAEDFAGAIYKTATTGSIITIDDGADDLPVREMRIAIEPVQDLHGYENPWPGGDGKNLLDESTNVINKAVNEAGEIVSNTTGNYSELIYVTAGETYTFSAISDYSTSWSRRVHGYSGDTWMKQLGVADGTKPIGTKYSITVTIPSGVDSIRISYCKNDKEAQFELGSEATDYAPFTNICPITGWNGVKVSRTGKNLFDKDANISANKFYYNSAGQTVSAQNYYCTDYIKVKPGTTYYWAINGVPANKSAGTHNAPRIACFDKDKRWLKSSEALGNDGNIIVVPDNGAYVRLPVYLNQQVYLKSMFVEDSMIPTEYEGFGQTYEVTLPAEAGTVYGGNLTIHADGTGELVVDRAFFEIDGSGTGYGVGGGTYKYVRYTPESSIYYYGTPTDGISNMFTEQAIGNTNADIGFGFANGRDIRIRYGLFTELTIAEAKEWLAEHPVQVCYKIASPMLYQLSAPQVRTLLGLNHIWADTGDITELIYPVNTDTAMALYEKADKVANATAGNFAALDAEGNLTDSNKSAKDFLDKEYEIGIFEKQWNGLTSFIGDRIWTDGENVYYSSDSDQYILDKSTSTWNTKTWNGISSFSGDNIWTDGENIYYSNSSGQRVLDKSTSTWNTKTWSGLSNFSGTNIWTDGKDIYLSESAKQYVLDKSTSTWNTKTWSGLTSYDGQYIWTDGENIYYDYSYESKHFVLDKSTSTWNTNTWNGFSGINGNDIWTDGENIYYSFGSSTQFVLDKSTSTWDTKTWSGFSGFSGRAIWTDGENIYYSWYENQYMISNNIKKLYVSNNGKYVSVPVKKFIKENVPVPSDPLKYEIELDNWSVETWGSTLAPGGQYIWTDGENVYFSYSTTQRVLDKSTSTWTTKSWSGITSFNGDSIWTDGENIYFSAGNGQFVLNKSTSTWSTKTWNNNGSNIYGAYIWTDGNNIYCSNGTQHYVLDKSNSAWNVKTWSGLTNFYGNNIWTDGENTYYSAGYTYVLNKSTSTWSQKTWNGTNVMFGGLNIWTNGKDIYLSESANQYVLDKATSIWSKKTWSGLTNFNGQYIWTDGKRFYYSNGSNQQYVLTDSPRILIGKNGNYSGSSVLAFVEEYVPPKVEVVNNLTTTTTGKALDASQGRTLDRNKINVSEKGAANGVAELDSNGRIPSSQLPSYVDDVLEYDKQSSFPSTGEAGKIYIAKDTNKTYRWSGSAYVEISASLALGTTSSTAYRGDYGNTAYTHAVTNKGSAFSSGLYKITTNSEGHVTAATAVAKADITALGIPSSDTTYSAATQSANGLMSSTDKKKLDTIANVFYVEGPTTDTTAGTWTGTCTGFTSYSNGLTILYRPNVAGASTTTLNINNLGAVTCYFSGNSKLTTHYAVGSVILFTYYNNGWHRADYDSNTNTQIRIYRQTTGYDDDYPFIVSRSQTIGKAGSNSSNTAVYGVVSDTDENNPTVNPSTGEVKVKKLTVADTVNGYKLAAASSKGVTDNTASTAVSASDTNLITARTLYYAGYTKTNGTVTSVATGVGLTGGTITGSGTIKTKLKSETASTLDSAAMGSTANRQYAVGVDKSGYLSVNVPWTDTNNDTKNTAGSTNSSSKLFLIGATTQAANPQTYSHDTAYVGTDGCLYSNGTKVLTAHQDISGKLDKNQGSANADKLMKVGSDGNIVLISMHDFVQMLMEEISVWEGGNY